MYKTNDADNSNMEKQTKQTLSASLSEKEK